MRQKLMPECAIEILVFDGDQRVAQHRREIVIARDHAPLQRERADDASVIVVEFGDRTGPVGFQSVDLRQVGRIDEQQSSGGSHQHGNQHQQTEQHAAHKPAPADFHRWQIFVERLHWEMRSQNSICLKSRRCKREKRSPAKFTTDYREGDKSRLPVNCILIVIPSEARNLLSRRGDYCLKKKDGRKAVSS